MFLTYLMLFVALMLSAVAAFYSIVGLTAIFAAAVVPIVIMGSILEAAKLVVTVWLHEYWHQVKLTMKLYLVPAVFILMVITSMGIFGFLSKAHTDQALVSGDASAKLAIVDEKIKIERENIANARAVIQQMDAAVTGVIATGDQEVKLKDGGTQIRSAAERSLQIRRSQARDRDALTRQIEEAQTRIVRLQEESAPLRAEFRKVEAEVGPIKYIAALIYGDNPDANLLEKAVRWVIIILVIVFDPLAVMMLLAFTESLRWERQKRAIQSPLEEKVDDISLASEPPTTPVMAGPPQQEPDSGPHPDQPPDNHEVDAQQSDPGDNLPLRSDGPDADQPQPDHQPAYLEKGFVSFQDLQPVVAQPEPKTDIDQDEEDPGVKAAMKRWKAENPDKTLKEQRHRLELGLIDELPWMRMVADNVEQRASQSGFGIAFPRDAQKGDTFVRVDRLPNQLFKFNGNEWIQIDKNQSDNYTYDEAYIDHLIQQLETGQYDPEMLSQAEADEIARRISGNQT
jgi:hypothetical protein